MLTTNRRWSTCIGVLLAALPLTGCGGPELLALEPCPDESVSLTVEGEGFAAFRWDPACPMAWVEVYEESSNRSVWVITGRGENVIRPVLRYGQRRDGVTVLVEPTPLVIGQTYVVRVLRLVGDPGGPQALIPAGVATFTR